MIVSVIETVREVICIKKLNLKKKKKPKKKNQTKIGNIIIKKKNNKVYYCDCDCDNTFSNLLPILLRREYGL